MSSTLLNHGAVITVHEALHLVLILVPNLGLDGSGLDGDDVDAIHKQLAAINLAEAFNGMLRDAVGAIDGSIQDAGNGTEHDDLARLLVCGAIACWLRDGARRRW